MGSGIEIQQKIKKRITNFGSKKILFAKEIVGPKNYWSKNFLIQKKFESKKILEPKSFKIKTYLGPIKFQDQKTLVQKIYQLNFESKLIFG